MKFKPETIHQAYVCLKETTGNHVLKITKDLLLFTINIHGSTYYLIHNLTKKNFELILSNDSVVTLTSRVFISSVKPIKANEIFINLFSDNISQLSSLDSVLDSQQKISKKEYSIKEIPEELLNTYFKDSKYLNKNSDYNEYIYAIDLPKEIKSKVDFEQTSTHLKIHLHTDRNYSLLHTRLVGNVIYTNNPIRVNNALEKLMLAIPNQKTKELEYIRSNMFYSLNSLASKSLKIPLNSLPDKDKFKQLITELEGMLN